MTAMLRHKPTGDLYVRTSLLAAREDMEPVEEDAESVESAAPSKNAKKKKGAAESPAVEDVVVEPEVPAETVASIDAALDDMFGGVAE